MPLLLLAVPVCKLISEAFPGPRQAISRSAPVFLSNRGLNFPVPMADPIHNWMGSRLLVGIVGAVVAARAGRGSARTRPASPSRRSRPASALVARPAASLVWLLGGAPQPHELA